MGPGERDVDGVEMLLDATQKVATPLTAERGSQTAAACNEWQDSGVGHCGTGSINESSGSNGLSSGSTLTLSRDDGVGDNFDVEIDTFSATSG
jgi:hypothetical protein